MELVESAKVLEPGSRNGVSGRLALAARHAPTPLTSSYSWNVQFFTFRLVRAGFFSLPGLRRKGDMSSLAQKRNALGRGNAPTNYVPGHCSASAVVLPAYARVLLPARWPQGVAVLRREAKARRADVMKKPSGPEVAAIPATPDSLLLAEAACSAGRARGTPVFAPPPLT